MTMLIVSELANKLGFYDSPLQINIQLMRVSQQDNNKNQTHNKIRTCNHELDTIDNYRVM